MVTRTFLPDEIPFDAERAYSFLRIQKTSDKFQIMREMVVRLRQQYMDYFEPRYRYNIYTVAGTQSGSFSILLDGGMSFTGEGIHRLLTHSRYAAVFLLTMGGKIDKAMAKVSQDDFTEAYFLDGVASTMTEGLRQLLKQDLQKEARRLHCEVSYRFSPGYAKWELKEQEKIFTLLRGKEIGMNLSDTYFMIPQKSLSGVYGMKPGRTNN